MASWANSRAAVMECRCDESSMSRGVMYVPNVPRPTFLRAVPPHSPVYVLLRCVCDVRVVQRD